MTPTASNPSPESAPASLAPAPGSATKLEWRYRCPACGTVSNDLICMCEMPYRKIICDELPPNDKLRDPAT